MSPIYDWKNSVICKPGNHHILPCRKVIRNLLHRYILRFLEVYEAISWEDFVDPVVASMPFMPSAIMITA